MNHVSGGVSASAGVSGFMALRVLLTVLINLVKMQKASCLLLHVKLGWPVQIGFAFCLRERDNATTAFGAK